MATAILIFKIHKIAMKDFFYFFIDGQIEVFTLLDIYVNCLLMTLDLALNYPIDVIQQSHLIMRSNFLNCDAKYCFVIWGNGNQICIQI